MPEGQATSYWPEFKEQPQRKVLSDISNTAPNGFGPSNGGKQKYPSFEPHTPAPCSEIFTVFDDNTDASLKKCETSSPHVQAKFADNLPGIENFAVPMESQDQYWREMSKDGPDGFGSPRELVSALRNNTNQHCLEAQAHDALHWGSVELPNDLSMSSPGDTTFDLGGWVSMTPQQEKNFDNLGLSPLEIPALPLFDQVNFCKNMDVDSSKCEQRNMLCGQLKLL